MSLITQAGQFLWTQRNSGLFFDINNYSSTSCRSCDAIRLCFLGKRTYAWLLRSIWRSVKFVCSAKKMIGSCIIFVSVSVRFRCWEIAQDPLLRVLIECLGVLKAIKLNEDSSYLRLNVCRNFSHYKFATQLTSRNTNLQRCIRWRHTIT